MIFVRDSRAHCASRTIILALATAGLAATLAGCAAGDIADGIATPASATAAAPAAATATVPATTTTTAVAPKAAPRVLSPTEINEECWTSNEVNKLKDLDAKAKLVDKCVAEKMKAQGM